MNRLLELNGDAEIITYEEYLPFGGTALIVGKTAREVTEKEYRYSGKERDDSTGLYYYGARYYATWLLRWINPDPAGTVDGLNLYLFVGGNSINNVDIGGMVTIRRSSGGRGRRSGGGRGHTRQVVEHLSFNEQPLAEYQQRTRSSQGARTIQTTIYGSSGRNGPRLEVINNRTHGTERAIATFEVMGFIHGSHYAIGILQSSYQFQNAATHQDVSGTGRYDAAHTFGIGINRNIVSAINEQAHSYLIRLIGRTNLTEGGSSMNRGIEQRIDAAQLNIINRYSYGIMRNTDFPRIINRLINSLGFPTNTTTVFAPALREGIRDAQQIAGQAYYSNFMLGRLYSAPLNSIDYYGNYNLAQSEDITTQLAQLSITANNDSQVDMLSQQMQMVSINEPTNNNRRAREDESANNNRNVRRRYG